jgi:hypothetical protein
MASDEALRLAAAVETLSGLIEDFGDSIDELDTRDLLEIPDTGERLLQCSAELVKLARRVSVRITNNLEQQVRDTLREVRNVARRDG